MVSWSESLLFFCHKHQRVQRGSWRKGQQSVQLRVKETLLLVCCVLVCRDLSVEMNASENVQVVGDTPKQNQDVQHYTSPSYASYHGP